MAACIRHMAYRRVDFWSMKGLGMRPTAYPPAYEGSARRCYG